MAILLKKNGITKKVATGFSWKSLLFGCLYAAARGDFKGFFIQIVLSLITGGFYWLFIPFFYNKLFLKRLITDGYLPADEDTLRYLQRNLKYSV
jgi:hypothetical protein